jgi:FG-GAP repeat
MGMYSLLAGGAATVLAPRRSCSASRVRVNRIATALTFGSLLCASPIMGAEFLNQATLAATDAIGSAQQGQSVALSADGNTAIVGGPKDNGGVGAAWVFTRSGGVWTEQAKLLASDAAGAANQGWSVALTSDGNTAVVGGPQDNSGKGAAWIYTRSNGVWAQQGSKLVGTGAVGNSNQGWSVAVSAVGILVGGPNDNSGIGAAWLFNPAGTQVTELIGNAAIGNANQGFSVALWPGSASSVATAVVGGPADNSNAGAVWTFTEAFVCGPPSGCHEVWGQTAKVTVSDAVGNAGLGSSVAMVAGVLIAGGPNDNSATGAAWVFTPSGFSWTEQAKLVGSAVATGANQGASSRCPAPATSLSWARPISRSMTFVRSDTLATYLAMDRGGSFPKRAAFGPCSKRLLTASAT